MPKTTTPSSIKGALNKKVGPLPLWGWGALAVGAYYVYRNVYSSKTGGSSSDTTQASNDLGPSYSPDYGYGGSGGAPASGGLPSDASLSSGDAAGQQPISITEPTINITNKIPRPRRHHHHPRPPHHHEPRPPHHAGRR